MERIEQPDVKGLEKDDLKQKLVNLCQIDPEKRLDEVLALIPEGEEVDIKVDTKQAEKESSEP